GVLKLDPFNDVSDVATNPPGVGRIVALTSNFFAGKFSFTLDAHATFDALKTPAFDYTAAFDLSSFLNPTYSLRSWNPSLSLASEGTVKLDTSDTNINDYLKFSANGQLLHDFYTSDPFHKEGQLLLLRRFPAQSPRNGIRPTVQDHQSDGETAGSCLGALQQ